MIASKGDPQMYKRQGKSNGWAAFDQQQRKKDIVDGRLSNDPFPSLSGPINLLEKPKRSPRNKILPVKPFSSVVVPSVDFQDSNKNKQSEVGNSGGQQRKISSDSNFDSVFRKLKEEYSWADDSLIEDIMVSVNNDLDMASSFLKAMISDNVTEDGKCCDSVSNGIPLPEKSEINAQCLQTVSEPPKTENGKEVGKNNFNGHASEFSDDLIEMKAMLGELTGVPVEPEWEEDDVYLSCRKDATKMMRAAASHSKAATNSFLRGDHYSAQQFSLKAQRGWESANRLNTDAAREILSIRNKNNGIWRLDLHGLHASEAVQALQEHLHTIETQLYIKGSSYPNNHASSSAGGNTMQKSLKWLEVITGIGNHSRGGAALPMAVKTFLVDNGYRIDEARPGVLMVRPKLRSS